MGGCTTKIKEPVDQHNPITQIPVQTTQPNLEDHKKLEETPIPAVIQPANLNAQTLTHFPEFYYYDKSKGQLLYISKETTVDIRIKTDAKLTLNPAVGYLANKTILLVGGTLRNAQVPLVVLINPIERIGHQLADLPFACMSGQAHEINDWIYYIGGIFISDNELTQAPLMRLNTKQNFWENLRLIAQQQKFDKIINMGTCSFADKILLIGGQRLSESSQSIKNSKKVYSISVENNFKVALEAKLPYKILKVSAAAGRKNCFIAGGILAKTNTQNRKCFCLVFKNQKFQVQPIGDLCYDHIGHYPPIYHEGSAIFISLPNIAVRNKHLSAWKIFNLTGKNTRITLENPKEVLKLNESLSSFESEKIKSEVEKPEEQQKPQEFKEVGDKQDSMNEIEIVLENNKEQHRDERVNFKLRDAFLLPPADDIAYVKETSDAKTPRLPETDKLSTELKAEDQLVSNFPNLLEGSSMHRELSSISDSKHDSSGDLVDPSPPENEINPYGVQANILFKFENLRSNTGGLGKILEIEQEIDKNSPVILSAPENFESPHMKFSQPHNNDRVIMFEEEEVVFKSESIAFSQEPQIFNPAKMLGSENKSDFTFAVNRESIETAAFAEWPSKQSLHPDNSVKFIEVRPANSPKLYFSKDFEITAKYRTKTKMSSVKSLENLTKKPLVLTKSYKSSVTLRKRHQSKPQSPLKFGNFNQPDANYVLLTDRGTNKVKIKKNSLFRAEYVKKLLQVVLIELRGKQCEEIAVNSFEDMRKAIFEMIEGNMYNLAQFERATTSVSEIFARRHLSSKQIHRILEKVIIDHGVISSTQMSLLLCKSYKCAFLMSQRIVYAKQTF